MNPQKHTWDTRAWLIGILGGIFSGGFRAWTMHPPLQKRLNTMPYFAFTGGHSRDVLSIIFGIFSLLLLPGILSGISRRRTFLWGLLPLCLFFVFVDIEDWSKNDNASFTMDLCFGPSMILICWVISSGPVSLIRWLRVRTSYQDMQEAASIPQEGVWPPPPNHNML